MRRESAPEQKPDVMITVHVRDEGVLSISARGRMAAYGAAGFKDVNSAADGAIMVFPDRKVEQKVRVALIGPDELLGEFARRLQSVRPDTVVVSSVRA